MANLQPLLKSSGKSKKKVTSIDLKSTEFRNEKYRMCMLKNCMMSDFYKYLGLKVKEKNDFSNINNYEEANSSFTYTVYSPQTREFHHRWHTNRGRIIDCLTCYNISERVEPFAKHYERNNERTYLVLTEDERKKLLIVESKCVSTFVMTKDNIDKGNMDFLSEASTDVLPSMLRLLFVKAKTIHIQVAYNVKIENRLYVFESTELAIENHFDIIESIDMVFMMLLETVKIFMGSLECSDIENFKIQRIKVNIRMERWFSQNGVRKMTLPLKYRIKNVAFYIDPEQLKLKHEKMESCDIEAITYAYKKYKATGNKSYLMRMKGANLYCFQLCQTSQEIYTVPFYLAPPTGNKENHNFIILEDVEGNFQHFMGILSPQHFAYTEDPKAIFICPKCQANYSELVKLAVHQRLKCGHFFEIFEVDNDYAEDYPNNFSIETSDGKWLLAGIRDVPT
ncbi:protein terminus-like [Teleopsis dalmanni]|uniref:protein terminus-like n=1 Tax=Teleopsis dalmanni TaxID=139649 RepID=UPI0018CDAE5B|nr:protein terminus-like [Teleopsis dalmanni]XP_037936070.1 protein terminus-like [Teleopsis dalmanni]XP_037936071.1 protein terminus-like [Teleopsis dalmanni]XP_037936664.1 protein terminus-like [Teleopsis dalmanni]XP_037936665.1 protein terminus-like [Teleopsis dalmanni]